MWFTPVPQTETEPLIDILTLACDITIPLLSILSDEEVHDKGDPIPVATILQMATFLNNFVFRVGNHRVCCWCHAPPVLAALIPTLRFRRYTVHLGWGGHEQLRAHVKDQWQQRRRAGQVSQQPAAAAGGHGLPSILWQPRPMDDPRSYCLGF